MTALGSDAYWLRTLALFKGKRVEVRYSGSRGDGVLEGQITQLATSTFTILLDDGEEPRVRYSSLVHVEEV